MTTKTKLISGLTFDLTVPYSEGHVVNAAEAKALNQTRLENIGNNVRKKLQEFVDEGKSPADIAAYVSEVDANYVFTLSSGGSRSSLDPYEREAIRIAKELVKAHLAKTGRKLTVAPEGVTEDEWESKIQDQIDTISTSEQVVKAAKKAVDAKRKQAEALAESIGEVSL